MGPFVNLCILSEVLLMRIFGKQLLLYLGTLVISFIFLGMVLAQGIRSSLTEQRIASLTNSAQRVARSVEGLAVYGIFNIPLVASQIQNLYDYLDAKVMIINADFAVLVAYGLPYTVVD